MHPAQASPSELIVSLSSATDAASLGPFTAEAASNLSSGSDFSSISSWGSPDPRQRPVGPGHAAGYPASYPIPLAEGPAITVPVSCCLSAAGVRLSGHPVPARELGLPHGRLTGQMAGPGRGFHVPHQRDTTGVGALSTPGTAVLSRPDAVPGQRLPLPSGQSLPPRACTPSQGSCLRGINEGSRDSPVRPAPRL
jgi:hypothetical protein